MVQIFIENIIASATLSGELDLQKIIDTLPNCEYNPNQFPGVIYKPGDPPIFVLLFNTGKVMVTAAKSVEDVEKGINIVETELKKAGLLTPVKVKEGKEPEEIAPEPEGQETDEDKSAEESEEKESEKGKEEGTEETEEETKEEGTEETKEEIKEEGKVEDSEGDTKPTGPQKIGEESKGDKEDQIEVEEDIETKGEESGEEPESGEDNSKDAEASGKKGKKGK